MAAQIGKVTAQLRDMVVSGELQPGDRVIELRFAAQLGVSRTPLRIALGELEKEGLLERLPARGFRVRDFSMEEVSDAVDVRGVLEGMAARLIAERGATQQVLEALRSEVAAGRACLQHAIDDPRASVDAHAWAEVNRRFHALLVEAAGNRALEAALEQNNKTPLSGPAALTLQATSTELETHYVLRAQADHEAIVEAITQREAVRVEFLLREHARRSRDNKKQLLKQSRQR